MGWLHGNEDGPRPATECRHGRSLSRYCPRCNFPSQEEKDQDALDRAANAQAKALEAAEKARIQAKQEADDAASSAAFLASLTAYERAVEEERWEDAYKLLPQVCYLHEFDSDGYPPPPKAEKKPSFTKFWETQTSGWKVYREKK